MRRLFCAVKVPYSDSIAQAIQMYQQALKGEKIRWVNPDNLHITLKFFGPTPQRDVKTIVQALGKAAAEGSPFAFNVQGCGTFGSARMPRVIWLGITGFSKLADLYFSVNKQLEVFDYTPDKKEFSPHLTIGRVKDSINTHSLYSVESELIDENFSKIKVNSFYLFESFLHPKGPEYKVVETFDLGVK